MSSSTPVQRALLLAVFVVVVAACSGAVPSVPPTKVPAMDASASLDASPSPSPSPSAGPSTERPSEPIAILPGDAWIVYQGGTVAPARIRLVRPDGTGDHELTPGDAPGEQFHPDWSHDGERVAFALDDTDGTRDIWVASVDGRDVRQLFECKAPCGWTDSPAWSPDDTEIAFERGFLVDQATSEGDSSIEVLDLATGITRSVYDGAATEYAYIPRWSPDGREIVIELERFESARLDAETVVASTLAILDIGGAAEPRLLLPWDSWASYPDWHPTDDRIAYVTPAEVGSEPADVVVIGLDGVDPERVTDFGPTGGRGIQPSWTPDGERIMFVGEDIVRIEPNPATIAPDGTDLERMPWDGTFRTHPRLRPTP